MSRFNLCAMPLPDGKLEKSPVMSYVPQLDDGNPDDFIAFASTHVVACPNYDAKAAKDLLQCIKSIRPHYHQTGKATSITDGAYFRYGCPYHTYRSAPHGGDPICDDTPSSREALGRLYTGFILFALALGMPEDNIELVKLYGILYLNGAYMGGHPDAPNEVRTVKFNLRVTVRIGEGSSILFRVVVREYQNRTSIVIKNAKGYLMNFPPGFSIYGMTSFGQGSLPLCFCPTLGWIYATHEVLKQEDGPVHSFVADFPFDTFEQLMKAKEILSNGGIEMDFESDEYSHLIFGGNKKKVMKKKKRKATVASAPSKMPPSATTAKKASRGGNALPAGKQADASTKKRKATVASAPSKMPPSATAAKKASRGGNALPAGKQADASTKKRKATVASAPSKMPPSANTAKKASRGGNALPAGKQADVSMEYKDVSIKMKKIHSSGEAMHTSTKSSDTSDNSIKKGEPASGKKVQTSLTVFLQWKCHQCTFLNERGSGKCKMCLAEEKPTEK